jgi:alpha-ribazole phosphatase
MFIDDKLNDRRSGIEDCSVIDWHNALKAKGDWTNGRVKDGESFLDIKKRVFSFLDDLKKKKQFSSVLIVTHSAIMKLIKAYCENLNDEETWKLKIDNGQIEIFDL